MTNSSNPVDEESVRKFIRQLILELAPNQTVGTYTPELRLLEDFQYNSLALMELAFTLEDEFGLDPISEEQARAIVTASDVEAHVISELLRKRGAPA